MFGLKGVYPKCSIDIELLGYIAKWLHFGHNRKLARQAKVCWRRRIPRLHVQDFQEEADASFFVHEEVASRWCVSENRNHNAPYGGVAKWLCSGLQSRLRRFDSGLRLQVSEKRPWRFFYAVYTYGMP